MGDSGPASETPVRSRSGPRSTSGATARRRRFPTPQQVVVDFWDSYIAKAPSSVTTIFPRSVHGTPFVQQRQQYAYASYEAAAEACKRAAERISRDCQRTNMMYTDPEFDLITNLDECCFGLLSLEGGSLDEQSLDERSHPNDADSVATSDRGDVFDLPDEFSVHRVGWIFDDPKFTVDGYSSSDVRQGGLSDCHFLSAVTTICHDAKLMERLCVVQKPDCGAYGFVFHRDGEWVYTIVDDYLLLAAPDFPEERRYDPNNEDRKKYKQQKQTGSDALLFARCKDPNETWLPLLEKAYAKVHGDFEAIHRGSVGDAVEDLTGGVTTVLITDSILDKKRLWKELMREHASENNVVFGLGVDGHQEAKNGLTARHAYAILQAVEKDGKDGKKVHMVKIR